MHTSLPTQAEPALDNIDPLRQLKKCFRIFGSKNISEVPEVTVLLYRSDNPYIIVYPSLPLWPRILVLDGINECIKPPRKRWGCSR